MELEPTQNKIKPLFVNFWMISEVIAEGGKTKRSFYT